MECAIDVVTGQRSSRFLGVFETFLTRVSVILGQNVGQCADAVLVAHQGMMQLFEAVKAYIQNLDTLRLMYDIGLIHYKLEFYKSAYINFQRPVTVAMLPGMADGGGVVTPNEDGSIERVTSDTVTPGAEADDESGTPVAARTYGPVVVQGMPLVSQAVLPDYLEAQAALVTYDHRLVGLSLTRRPSAKFTREGDRYISKQSSRERTAGLMVNLTHDGTDLKHANSIETVIRGLYSGAETQNNFLLSLRIHEKVIKRMQQVWSELVALPETSLQILAQVDVRPIIERIFAGSPLVDYVIECCQSRWPTIIRYSTYIILGTPFVPYDGCANVSDAQAEINVMLQDIAQKLILLDLLKLGIIEEQT